MLKELGLKKKSELASLGSEPNEICYRLLQSAIYETLTGVFGQTVHEHLRRHLEEKYHVSDKELPNRLDILCNVLEGLLGPIASATVGRAIARNLYGKLGIEFVAKKGCELPYYVLKARSWISSHK